MKRPNSQKVKHTMDDILALSKLPLSERIKAWGKYALRLENHINQLDNYIDFISTQKAKK